MNIAGSSIISVLDLDDEDPWRGPIETAFTKYAKYLSYPGTDGILAVLEHPNLQITDWIGWTKVEKIIRHKYDIGIWTQLNLASSSVVCTQDSAVCIWDQTQIKRGFNGTMQFPYKIIKLSDLSPMDCGREWYMDAEDGSVFSQYKPKPSYYEGKISYSIHTKSGFYNVNRIVCGPVDINSSGWK